MPAWMITVANALMNAGVWLLTGLFALGTAGELVLHEPPVPPAIPDAADFLSQEITVLSFNVWIGNEGELAIDKRFNGVVQTILNEKPDSFGLQEATEAWRLPLWWRLRGDYGIACWKGRYYGLQEAVPIFYNKSKYKLVEEGVFWLSESPDKTSVGWDADLPRVAGYAVLWDKSSCFTYLHINAHFDHRGGIARANSARMIADFINEKGLPTVFTADVNAAPGSLPAQYLEAGGLIDLRFAAAETDHGGTFHNYRAPGGAIDYIYANHYLRDAAYFKVIRDEYDGKLPSDHYAVAARLTLGN